MKSIHSLIIILSFSPLFAQATLKDAYEGIFRIGVALNEAQFSGKDAAAATLASAQFNSISPENVLKWEVVHPKPGVYNFEPGDKYVAFGEKNGMQIIGHCLVWHNQVPKWVFEDESGKPISRDALLARMKDHIEHVVGHYKGRIQGWDVVNEAINEDGSMRKSPWLTIIGDDFMSMAFDYGQATDPAAKLLYNDYNMAVDEKRAGVIALITKLKAQGTQVDVAGLQGHLKLDRPTAEQYDRAISELAATGVKLAITELDIDVLPAATRSMNGRGRRGVRPHRPASDPYAEWAPEGGAGATRETLCGIVQCVRQAQGRDPASDVLGLVESR